MFRGIESRVGPPSLAASLPFGGLVFEGNQARLEAGSPAGRCPSLPPSFHGRPERPNLHVHAERRAPIVSDFRRDRNCHHRRQFQYMRQNGYFERKLDHHRFRPDRQRERQRQASPWPRIMNRPREPARLAVGSQSVTITQAGPPCNFALNPNSASISALSQSGSFKLSGLAGCTWTAASNASFLQVTRFERHRSGDLRLFGAGQSHDHPQERRHHGSRIDVHRQPVRRLRLHSDARQRLVFVRRRERNLRREQRRRLRLERYIRRALDSYPLRPVRVGIGASVVRRGFECRGCPRRDPLGRGADFHGDTVESHLFVHTVAGQRDRSNRRRKRYFRYCRTFRLCLDGGNHIVLDHDRLRDFGIGRRRGRHFGGRKFRQRR